MKTPLKPLTPAASAATDKFLEHIVTCGHCQSFPRSLCQTGAVLQRKASLERMENSRASSRQPQSQNERGWKG
jgi:hypothetical protein